MVNLDILRKEIKPLFKYTIFDIIDQVPDLNKKSEKLLVGDTLSILGTWYNKNL